MGPNGNMCGRMNVMGGPNNSRVDRRLNRIPVMGNELKLVNNSCTLIG